MEDEIKINEYVRTKNKGIKRIDRIDNNKTVNKYLYFTGIEDFEGKEYGIIKTTEIVKHSKIISEVVEIGDYVNGKLIHKIDKGPNYCYLYYGNCKTFVDYQIQTILTKEQYIANCYKVGGE